MAQTLFNQPHSASSAVAWQPHADITKKLSSRGYSTTQWTRDEPQAFADLGFTPKSSGFSAAHYQPTKQALSPQAKASLALLEGESRNDAVGTEPADAVEPTVDTNAHLPFVMDDFGATHKMPLSVTVDPSVLERALAQAELAESLVLSPITSDDTPANPIVIHPDEAEADAHVDADAALADMASDATVLAEDVVAAVDATPVAAEPAVPELPAVVGGITPEEVEQREAEQFAKGLAQGREEAEARLAEAVEQAMQEGLAQGLAQGKAEGLAEGVQQGVAQGHEQGRAEGEQTARAAVADEMAAQRVVFENAAHELGALIEDPKKFFEPLKRLALHIAEQVVVGELKTSSQAIERLVQRCLDELDHPVHGAVVLELNPQDKDMLLAQGGDFTQGMRVEAVHDMQRGSVRVFANDTVVEDLVEHRLKGLAHALLVDEEAWLEKSPLAQRILDVQKEAEDEDVHS